MSFFGSLIELSVGKTTIIFSILLLVLLLFKSGLHILEVVCARNGFKELLENLYREFMIMGFVSFGVFITTELNDYSDSSLYHSFHFVHLVILFVGLTFILQAILIIVLIASRKGALLRFSLISSGELLLDYHALMSSNDTRSFLFLYGPLSVSFPELREKIENRILKDFFIRTFNLPEEFNFVLYTGGALKSYVISLSELRPLNWLILAVLAFVNYLKVKVVDDHVKSLGHCFLSSTDNAQPVIQPRLTTRSVMDLGPLSSPDSVSAQYGFTQGVVSGLSGIEGDSRALAGGFTEAQLCREYFLSYSVFAAFMLTLFLFALLIASEIYMTRLLQKVLDMEIDLQWQDVEEEGEAEAEAEEQAWMLHSDIDTLWTSTHREPTKKQKPPSSSLSDLNATPTPAPSTDAPPTLSLQSPSSLSVSHASDTDDFIPTPAPAKQSKGGETHHNTTSVAQSDHSSSHRSQRGIVLVGKAQSSDRGGPVAEDRKGCREGCLSAFGIGRRGVDRLRTRSSSLLPPKGVLEELKQQQSDINNTNGTSHSCVQYLLNSLPGTHLNSRFLYRKCLERICRAEEARRSRHSIALTEPFLSPANLARDDLAGSTAWLDGSCHSVVPVPHVAPPSLPSASHPPTEVTSAPGLSPSTKGPHADPSASQRGIVAHRSVAASNILSWAAFQSHQRNTKWSGRDVSDISPHQPAIEHRASSSYDPNDALEAGLGPTIDLPRINSTASSVISVTGPTRIPCPRPQSEYLTATPTSEDSKEGPRVIDSGRGNSLTSIIGVDDSLRRSRAGSLRDLNEAKPTRGTRQKTEKSHSDRFFEMASPDDIIDISSHLTDSKFYPQPKAKMNNGSTTGNGNGNGNGGDGDGNVPRMEQETCWEKFLKSMTAFKKFLKLVYKKSLPLLGKLFDGLYHVLVLGPHVAGGPKSRQELDDQDDEVKIALQTDLSSIFLWSNADLYYRAIEFSLLLQCVYIALWCTNFAVIAEDSQNSAQWEILLLIPVPLNFYLLKLVLNFACVLRSASVLDEEIAVKICEDAIDERVVTQRLRKMVRASLQDIEPNKADWPLFLCELFSYYIAENKEGLAAKPFTLFLHGLKIYLSESSVEKIFKVIDFDQNGFISYPEFFEVVFPELPRPADAEKRKSMGTLRSYVPTMKRIESIAHDMAKMSAAPFTSRGSSDNLHARQTSVHDRARRSSVDGRFANEMDPI